VVPPELPCTGRWALEPPPELPRARRRALASRGNVAPPDPPRARRWAPEPRGTPGAALHREVGAGAAATRGGRKAALSQEVGARVAGTRGSPRTALSRELGTTPPPPPPHPSACGQGVVVPVTSPHNPHRMITRGKTGFKVAPDHLVLTDAVPDPLLRLCCACRSPLACGYGGRIRSPDQQWDLGAGSPTSGI
jgi:hypothetical protein